MSPATPKTITESIAAMPPKWRELWEERAAIREYCGGMARDEAEKAAIEDVRRIFKHTASLEKL